MSDQRLRDLERAWKRSGSVEDEAAYLREQVRIDQLDFDKLVLAAGVGSEAAQALEGSFPPEEWSTAPIPGDLGWRDKATICSAMLPVLDRQYIPGERDWSAERFRDLSRRIDLFVVSGQLQTGPDPWTEVMGHPNDCEPGCCWEVEDYVAGLVWSSVGLNVKSISYLEKLFWTLDRNLHPNHARHSAWFAEIRSVVVSGLREELVPWLLGRADPIAERVATRSAS